MQTSTVDTDVVIVGARCAGAATARLLAERGLRVVVLDKQQHGSDTLSTHALMRGAVIQLHRWNLLDSVVATGTPAIRRATFHYPDGSLPLTLGPSHGVDALYAPRRTVLDPILVAAATAAGAQFRFGVTVTDVLRDEHGHVTGVRGHDRSRRRVEVRAGLVIGADGMYSKMARLVGAPTTHRGHHEGAVIYSYHSGVEADGYEWFFGDHTAAGIIPTNDDQSVVFASTSTRRFEQIADEGVEVAFERLIDRAAPSLHDRLAGAVRTERRRHAKGIPGYLRRASGPGWALVGDAGSFKDPIAAHGITDALRDAEKLARAITGSAPLDEALRDYEAHRDELTLPIMRLADSVGSYEWDTSEVQQLLLDLNAAMNVEVEAIAAMDDTSKAA